MLNPALRIWQAIERLGLAGKRQVDLAEMFGVAQPTISAWANGNGGIDLDRAVSLEEKAGIRAAWVLFGESPMLTRELGVDRFEQGYQSGYHEGLRRANAEIAALLAKGPKGPDGAEVIPPADRIAAVHAAGKAPSRKKKKPDVQPGRRKGSR